MSSYIGKSDPVLGKEVSKHLQSKGIQTPTYTHNLGGSDEVFDSKIEIITKHMTEVLNTLGLDLRDDSLCDTPRRVAKMYVKELFWGLNPDNFPKCTTVENKMGYTDNFVLENGITIQSVCEHHFVNISGSCSIAYIPRNNVLGLSKLNRIAQYFAKRPQVQERLTEQIAETISFVADTPDVACYINAEHYCVKSRGIQDTNSSTVTLATRGVFNQGTIRAEFLSTLGH